MKKVLLKIDGMTCSGCSSGLEKYLNRQEGIKNATVNLVMNNANIEYDDKKLNIADLEKFVEKAGFKSLGIDNFQKIEKKKKSEKNRLILITIISILVLYISMSHMIGLPDIPYLNMMEYPINYSISLFIFTSKVTHLKFLFSAIFINSSNILVAILFPLLSLLVTILVICPSSKGCHSPAYPTTCPSFNATI